ncbi:hypothetical protein FYK55_21840 [Roseiconus nitratireducens]|uniref:Uncharacterized protein n=1 Tax=Roseiconus nitratireducens TaxID=2605748 RepID=A0A5M6CYI9_9BACT|nr:hypothetical protein [Roseiconus nitratireducens]KAA5540271.1 hypothetical protein FYK55_21840 [Roseiconus nitratireducens]
MIRRHAYNIEGHEAVQRLKVIRALTHHQCSRAEKIASRTRIAIGEVERLLDAMVSEGLLERSLWRETDCYRVVEDVEVAV